MISQVPDALRRFFDMPDEGQEPPPPLRHRSPAVAASSCRRMGTSSRTTMLSRVPTRSVCTFADRRYFPDAEIIGADPFTDVAVIKVDTGEDLRVQWQSATRTRSLNVGEWILAIGNPGLRLIDLNSTSP